MQRIGKLIHSKWFIFFVPLILMLITGPIRFISISYDLFITPFLLMASSFLLSRYSKIGRAGVFRLLLFGYALVILIGLVEDSFEFNMFFQTNNVANLLGISGGYLIERYAYKKQVVIIVPLVVLLFSVAGFKWFVGMGLNYDSFGSFTGEIQEPIPQNTPIGDGNGGQVELNNASYGKKQLVIFWSNYCGICISEFPQVTETFKNFKNDPRVQVHSINVISQPKDTARCREIMDMKKVEFPVGFMGDSVAKSLGVYFFPTVLIMDSGTILFRGKLKDALQKLKS